MMTKNEATWKDKVRIIGLSCDDDLDSPNKRISEKGWDKIE